MYIYILPTASMSVSFLGPAKKISKTEVKFCFLNTLKWKVGERTLKRLYKYMQYLILSWTLYQREHAIKDIIGSIDKIGAQVAC